MFFSITIIRDNVPNHTIKDGLPQERIASLLSGYPSGHLSWAQVHLDQKVL